MLVDTSARCTELAKTEAALQDSLELVSVSTRPPSPSS